MVTRRAKGVVALAAVLFVLAITIWASDRITLQGERTIYTVRCVDGVWQGARCTGRLVAGERYAFRVSVLRKEVLYWVRGSRDPSGKFSDCKITDRDNWACTLQPGQKAPIAIEMKKGKPMHSDEPGVVAFHKVPKWKWWLLDFGLTIFNEAGGGT